MHHGPALACWKDTVRNTLFCPQPLSCLLWSFESEFNHSQISPPCHLVACPQLCILADCKNRRLPPSRLIYCGDSCLEWCWKPKVSHDCLDLPPSQVLSEKMTFSPTKILSLLSCTSSTGRFRMSARICLTFALPGTSTIQLNWKLFGSSKGRTQWSKFQSDLLRELRVSPEDLPACLCKWYK